MEKQKGDASPTVRAAPESLPRASPVHMKSGLSGQGFPIYRFVVTGGPCAGKTTCLSRMSNFLRDRGFHVYSVPEAATMLFANGASQFTADTDEDTAVQFQIVLMRLQMALEDTFTALAQASAKQRPCVLLCDRGTMDGSAYLSEEGWQQVSFAW